jgi:muramoyltetrapeptide carboxypeptidase
VSRRFLPVEPLRPGDLIGVCAPSGPVDAERLTAGVSALERLGFRVRVPEGVLERTGFTAGHVLRRKRELEELFGDREVRAVFAARGGAGAIELLPLLTQRSLFLDDPKPFVGYSDVTFLHLLLGRLGLVSFHGPMVARGLDKAFDEGGLVHALCGGGELYSAPPGSLRPLRAGVGEGTLLGGCLSILASAAGTCWALKPDHATLLFVEDVAEPPYRIHRMLQQLRLSGAMDQVRGIIFGQMPDCRDPGGLVSLEDAIREALGGLDVPVAIGLASGHTTGDAVTLPLGCEARLACDGTLAHFALLSHGVR